MKLRLLNDPALRTVCVPVEQGELDHIKSLVPEMQKVLDAKEGLALAANQVGITKRFFLMKDGKLIINPVILEMGPITKYEGEGCLSIPGTSSETQRAQKIKVSYKDENWTDVEAEYNGQDAVAFQHEIDHLDGKLYTDQLKPMKRQLVLQKHRKFIKMRSRHG